LDHAGVATDEKLTLENKLQRLKDGELTTRRNNVAMGQEECADYARRLAVPPRCFMGVNERRFFSYGTRRFGVAMGYGDGKAPPPASARTRIEVHHQQTFPGKLDDTTSKNDDTE